MSVFWNGPAGALSSWYVNLEQPQVRTNYGFSLHDEMLDVLIAPDRKSWAWKDEEELAEAVRLGYFSPDDELRLRANGLAAVEFIQSGNPPFDMSWADFKPDPGWGIPPLLLTDEELALIIEKE
jgi:predicted RNA-binding protein associated with RNAse of E/G family